MASAPLPAVSVALPVHIAPPGNALERAASCITGQTLRDLELLLILNGSDAATTARVESIAASDTRVRILRLPKAGLSAALNLALRQARHSLVARMDADDECPRERLALQAAHMAGHPALAALGAAWELIGPDGRTLTTVRPPCEPAALRWRLLLGNTLAHGSMMLRRETVLAAGGYDERCHRAQDYELWLRLSRQHELGCLPQTLYRHRTRFPDDPGRSTPDQAAIVAPNLLQAWSELPAATISARQEVESVIRASLARTPESGGGLEVERMLHGSAPSREGLIAWLWDQWNRPAASRRALDCARRARLREVARDVRDAGAEELWLWGVGEHTRWLLGNAGQLGMPVAGLVDDALAGTTRFGFMVGAPVSLVPGSHVLISSDSHEDDIWVSSAPHRVRGIRVWRLYEEPPDQSMRPRGSREIPHRASDPGLPSRNTPVPV